MPTLKIDGVEVTVPTPMSILEVARTLGIEVPHYCYHPGLSVVGQCRLCQVEVERMPKLATACNTMVADGMVVWTHSPKVEKARRAVMEFYLLNHPLDCPICDKGGECPLQDFTLKYGPGESRFAEEKVQRVKHAVLGPHIVFDAERCILCTRCVRFCHEVPQTGELGVFSRGDRSEISLFPGKVLDNAYSGNVIDLCPVGSLLSKDFLNKARSWELDRTASVCSGCSQGCNMIVETRDNAVVRLRPRPNADVNEFFMCDHGRLNYRWMNRGDRLEAPSVLGPSGPRASDWDVALAGAARVLKGKRVHVVASPNLSNEALFFLSRIIKASGGRGTFRVEQGPEAPLPGVEDLALRADRAANGRGAELLGFERTATPFAGVTAGDAVIVADHELTPDDAASLTKASAVVLISTFMPAALSRVNVVLPIANHVEEDGTFTNLRGRVQRFLQARAAPGMARPSWYVLADLCTALGDRQDVLTPAQAFASLAASQPAFPGLSYDSLGLRGALVAGATAGAAS